jgi:hypothetical protein
VATSFNQVGVLWILPSKVVDCLCAFSLAASPGPLRLLAMLHALEAVPYDTLPAER